MINMAILQTGQLSSCSSISSLGCKSLLLLCFFAFAGYYNTMAQNPVDILEADLLEGGVVEGQKVQKILGNVYLKSVEQDLEIYCDSAYQFEASSEIRAFGNIQINTEDEKIWADSLIYFTDIDFSQLRGRVIIEADSTTLFGNSVDYRFSTKVAHFIDEIRLEDPEGVLRANSGFYFREADSAVFRGQVQIQDSTQYIEGDSLFSNRGKKYYEMHSNIYADNTENNTTLKGDYLEADSTGRRLLTGNAWLRNVDLKEDTTDKSQDSLKVVAREPVAETYRPDSLSFVPDTIDRRNRDVRQLARDTTITQEPYVNTQITQTDSTRKVVTHVVNRSETLFRIAQYYRVGINEIKNWNNLGTNQLRAGQSLRIRLPEGTRSATHTVKDQETLFSISQEYNVPVERIQSWNNLGENIIQPGQELTIYLFNGESRMGEPTFYRVQRGDNLFSIAQKHNVDVDELRTMNNLDTDAITVGQRLIVAIDSSKSPAQQRIPQAREEDSPARSPLRPPPVPQLADSNLAASDADTTHIRAQRILSTRLQTPADTTTIVNAFKNVRIWSPNFSAVSDTSRYNESSETFELWSTAKAWHNEVQLSGPYIKVILNEGDVERLEAYPKPFSVQKDTVTERLNQIKGDTLNAYFDEGSLSMIHVFGGSHLLRYTKNEEDQPDGAVELTAPSTRIFFEGGEVSELKSDGNIDGSYLPENESTANRQLEGFIWTPELRPQRPKQNLQRRFTPIPPERPFELPRRYIEHIENLPQP